MSLLVSAQCAVAHPAHAAQEGPTKTMEHPGCHDHESPDGSGEDQEHAAPDGQTHCKSACCMMFPAPLQALTAFDVRPAAYAALSERPVVGFIPALLRPPRYEV